MSTTTQSPKRLALIAGGAAIAAMGFFAVGSTVAEGNGIGPALSSAATLANHAGAPLAPGSSGGEITRGNQSGFFAPTKTNDLMTPQTPPPGSPWRD